MKSTTSINLNLQLPNYSVAVYAVQGDTMSREIEAALFDGQTPFTPPAGALGTVRYYKPDGTSGFYDTLEDEETVAVTWDDNIATIRLAEQTVTVPGEVLVQLSFYSADAERLSAFTFRLFVEKNPYSDQEFESTDYYSVLTARIAAVLNVTTHAPSINNLGHWVLWDDETQQYYDSGVDATGPQGPQGATGPQGPAGRDGQGSPGLATPLPDNTNGSAGESTSFSREDHQHPLPKASDIIANNGDSVQTNIDELPNRRKYVIIGDSYGLGITYGGTTTGWIERFKQYLSLSNSDCYSSAVGGSGFIAGTDTFNSQLTTLAATITDKEQITDVMFVGGYNDNGQTQADLGNAISVAVQNAKTNFPNAKVWIIFCGFNVELSGAVRDLLTYIQQYYAFEALKNGATFFNASYAVKMHSSLMSYDGIHPTDVGYQVLAIYIGTKVLGGMTTNTYGYNVATLSKVQSENDPLYTSITQRYVNNSIVTVFPASLDTFDIGNRSTKPDNQQWYKLCNVSNCLCHGLGTNDTGDDWGSVQVGVIFRVNLGSSVVYKEGVGSISFNYGGLWIKLNNLENGSYMNYANVTHISIKSCAIVHTVDTV